MTHDPLCRHYGHDEHRHIYGIDHDGFQCWILHEPCDCALINKARADERKRAAQRVEQAWQKFDDYETIECQQCYTKEAFDLAREAARGEQA